MDGEPGIEATNGAQLRKASETYVQQIKRRAHKIQKQKVQRLAAAAAASQTRDRRSERTKTATVKALEAARQQNDGPHSSLSDNAASLQSTRRRLRGSYSSTRSGYGSSSSIVDVTTAGGEFSSEDRGLLSPLSDSGLYHTRHQKLDTMSVPSASSLDDLTVKSPLTPLRQHDRNRRHGKNTAKSVGSEEISEPVGGKMGEGGGGEGVDGGGAGKGKGGERRRRDRKRTRRGEGGSTSRKRRKVGERKAVALMNGVVNGTPEYKVVLWDLVWAKCRGYPPYPALVS